MDKCHRRPFSQIKNNKGVALIIAVFAITFIMYLAMEVSYESNVEYIVNSGQVHRLKAYYAAKAGVEISLLRIHLYKQIMDKFGKQLGDYSSMLDQIWSFPFAWPPVLPDNVTAVDKDMLKKTITESSMDAQYMVTISDEGSKIDVNDLNSPVKSLRDNTRQQLLNILENKVKTDENWAKRNPDVSPEKIVNAMTDWVTETSESLNGGDKSRYYKNSGGELPPKRPFRTVGEIRMVADMTDEVFAILETHVTVYGMKGVNPNLAPKDVLKSLDPSITEEVATELIKRRDNKQEGGPYKNVDDFIAYVNAKGGRMDKSSPVVAAIIFDSPYNFKIKSTGLFGKSTSEIEAVVADMDKVKTRIVSLYKAENPVPTPIPAPGTTPITSPTPNPAEEAKKSQSSLPKGRPQIVYWIEK